MFGHSFALPRRCIAAIVALMLLTQHIAAAAMAREAAVQGNNKQAGVLEGPLCSGCNARLLAWDARLLTCHKS